MKIYMVSLFHRAPIKIGEEKKERRKKQDENIYGLPIP